MTREIPEITNNIVASIIAGNATDKVVASTGSVTAIAGTPTTIKALKVLKPSTLPIASSYF